MSMYKIRDARWKPGCLEPAQQRGGKVFDGFGVQLGDRADLQEPAAGILVLDSLRRQLWLSRFQDRPAQSKLQL